MIIPDHRKTVSVLLDRHGGARSDDENEGPDLDENGAIAAEMMAAFKSGSEARLAKALTAFEDKIARNDEMEDEGR